ncbi:MAG: DUF3352 domain-containing protein, partial [Verrucomicrobia bacterium]|nr:DUF3352 domain-containing protein [Verrucomicrobiota bacterium]
MSFSATGRFKTAWRARNTEPMPPSPRSLVTANPANVCPSSSVMVHLSVVAQDSQRPTQVKLAVRSGCDSMCRSMPRAEHVAERASVQPAASERWRVQLHDRRSQLHPSGLRNYPVTFGRRRCIRRRKRDCQTEKRVNRFMKTKHLILLALALEAAVLADEPPPVSQWIPSEAVVVLEINKPEALLDALLSEDLEKAVTNLPQYQAFTAVPQFRQVRGITQIIEAQLDADWRTALRKLVGRGLCIAVGAGGEMLLSVECQDKALLEQAHKSVQAFASAAAANKSPSEAPASKEYRGVTTWSFGPKEAHAIVGDRFLLANNSQALEHALDLRAGSGGQSLASRAAYKDAVNALGSDAVARLFVDMGALKQAPRIKQALARGGEPLGALLTAGTRDPLDSANWLGLGLYVKGDTLTLRAVNDGKLPDPATPSGFATPRGPQDGAWPNLR